VEPTARDHRLLDVKVVLAVHAAAVAFRRLGGKWREAHEGRPRDRDRVEGGHRFPAHIQRVLVIAGEGVGDDVVGIDELVERV